MPASHLVYSVDRTQTNVISRKYHGMIKGQCLKKIPCAPENAYHIFIHIIRGNVILRVAHDAVLCGILQPLWADVLSPTINWPIQKRKNVINWIECPQQGEYCSSKCQNITCKPLPGFATKPIAEGDDNPVPSRDLQHVIAIAPIHLTRPPIPINLQPSNHLLKNEAAAYLDPQYKLHINSNLAHISNSQFLGNTQKGMWGYWAPWARTVTLRIETRDSDPTIKLQLKWNWEHGAWNEPEAYLKST